MVAQWVDAAEFIEACSTGVRVPPKVETDMTWKLSESAIRRLVDGQIAMAATIRELREQVATIPALTDRIAGLEARIDVAERLARSREVEVVALDGGRFAVMVCGVTRSEYGHRSDAKRKAAEWLGAPAWVWQNALAALT